MRAIRHILLTAFCFGVAAACKDARMAGDDAVKDAREARGADGTPPAAAPSPGDDTAANPRAPVDQDERKPDGRPSNQGD